MATLKEVTKHLTDLRTLAADRRDTLRARLPTLTRAEEVGAVAIEMRECEAKVHAYSESLSSLAIVDRWE